ncbi:ATP-grasp fold amidoligase family protein [Pseudonocardia ailaonensis]|uniref:ATP-grasp fold amidoligase family protein n=1 Tax=Pseudonocardia ailaonensis TaxID=367279 RepID=A0ABN2NCS9_9PSEU
MSLSASFAARVVLARRLRFLPPRAFAVAHHALFQGELTTLRRPRTYSQLLAAKNLREQPEMVHVTADKYAVREHVAERIGAAHLIPLHQVVDRAEDLDLAARTRPYVVKGTHGCDMTLLVRDPAAADHAAIRATVARWLDTDFYEHGWREAPYKGLPRRAVVEEFLGDGVTPPADHKFFVFHGEPTMVVVDQDRFSAHTSTLLHPDWCPFAISGRFAQADALPPRPASYDRMLEIARTLGADFEFARIDLYEVDGHVYFGEITHNPGGGLVRLKPREFDRALGDLWRDGVPVPERFVQRERQLAG